MHEHQTGLDVVIYTRPNGKTQQATIRYIRQEDAEWFSEHAQVSMEDIGSDIVVYADIGLTEDDGETPRECIEFSKGRSCEDTMSALRAQCEKELREASH